MATDTATLPAAIALHGLGSTADLWRVEYPKRHEVRHLHTLARQANPGLADPGYYSHIITGADVIALPVAGGFMLIDYAEPEGPQVRIRTVVTLVRTTLVAGRLGITIVTTEGELKRTLRLLTPVAGCGTLELDSTP